MDVQKDISKNYIKKYTNLNHDVVVTTLENEKKERNDHELGMMTIDHE